jgi:hypothetical protein
MNGVRPRGFTFALLENASKGWNLCRRPGSGLVETGRVLRAFLLSEDAGEGKQGDLEARAKDRQKGGSGGRWQGRRRGGFGGGGVCGKGVGGDERGGGRKEEEEQRWDAAARAHDEAEAERLVVAALAELGAPGDASALAGRGRWMEEKVRVAALVRNRMTMGVAGFWPVWEGHEVSFRHAVRRYGKDAKPVRKLGSGRSAGL